jgi:hypothetical protein
MWEDVSSKLDSRKEHGALQPYVRRSGVLIEDTNMTVYVAHL